MRRTPRVLVAVVWACCVAPSGTAGAQTTYQALWDFRFQSNKNFYFDIDDITGSSPVYYLANNGLSVSGVGDVLYQEQLATGSGNSLSVMNSVAVRGLFPTTGGSDYEYWQDVLAITRSGALIEDTLTISGTSLSGVGSIQYFWSLDGSVYARAENRGGYLELSEMRTVGSLVLTHAGQENILVREVAEIPAQALYNGLEPQDDLRIISTPLIASPRLDFNVGQPFDTSYGLYGYTLARLRNVDNGNFRTDNVARLESTATFLGVAIYDQQGQLISDVTIDSTSGLEYHLVPEPGAFFLVLVGLVLLYGCRRFAGTPTRARTS